MTRVVTCIGALALGLTSLGGFSAVGETRDPDRMIGVSVPSRRAAIAPEQDGTIVQMDVAEGHPVARDQVLFKLNTVLLELEVQRLDALANTDLSVLKARTALDHVRQRERRQRSLASSKIVSASEIEQLEAEARIAELQLRIAEFDKTQAKNQLLQAQQRLRKRTLRSPIDGVVARVMKQPGETAERLTPVLEVITLDPLWVEFECPVAQQDVFHPGAEVLVTPAADPTDTRTAKIVYVSMEADPSTHTFLARAAIPNGTHAWRAGLKMWVRHKPATATPHDVQATPPRPGGR